MKLADCDSFHVPSRWIFALCVLSIGHSVLIGSTATNAIIPYGVRIWQTDEGLPQNSVFAIAQTTDGYLWVGTHEGLARFDGVRFTVVEEPSAPELKQGWITALLTASDGSLWI